MQAKDGPTFPHRIADPLHGTAITLYAERDRPTVTYRFHRADGKRTPKVAVPKEGLSFEARRNPTDNRVPDELIEWARRLLTAQAAEAAGFRRPAGVKRKPNDVAIGIVFGEIRKSGWYQSLSPKRRTEVGLPMRWVESVLGRRFRLHRWDANTIERLRQARMVKGIETIGTNSESLYLPAASRNTFVRDLRCIGTVFAEALSISHNGGWLLDHHPNERFRRKLPKYGARRRRTPVSHEQYTVLLEYSDEVDPSGRFRFFLTLVRWTGRRISTIRRMKRSTLLFTADEIRAALARQLNQYVLPADYDRVARLYSEVGGALYIEAAMEKSGQSGNEGDVEQYDAVIPVPPVVMAEARRYLDEYWERGKLDATDPLFPGGRSADRPVLRRAVSNETVNEWFNRALMLAAEA